MSVIFIVLPLAFVLAGCAVAAFIWAVRGGQLDDLETPGERILFDDADGVRGGVPARAAGGPQRSATGT